MPRRLRVPSAGIVYHALNRSVKQLVLFSSDWDYGSFEQLLFEAKQQAAVRLLSYCLMRNHWHLILCPERDGDLSRFLHWLTLTHARRWNDRQGTSGTGAVYQGRFKAIPIQSNGHFLTACRYVERNPLRANLVSDATDWRWSSLWRRRKGRERGLLDTWPVTCPVDWEDYVNTPQSDAELAALREAIRRGRPLGDAAWQQQTAQRLQLTSSLRPRGRPRKNIPDPFLTD
ncbi:MAG: transposase [Acidobacteriota bacterium]